MKFELACNWDPALIDGLKGYPPVELFGGMPGSTVAGGRASFVAPEVSEKDAENYIKAAVSAGHPFNFLLNASCLDNREYRRDEYEKILKHIEWVAGTGAESVTVTIPYLIQIIKKHFPSLKVNVSSWARVETVRKAQFFEDMGADGIVLSEEINRDFRTLEAIRKAVRLKLILIANPGCLYGCPRSFYHANVMTHGSQGGHASEGFLVDHCYFSCTKEKMKDPVELVKIRWIRPEDITDYELIGIDCLKIIDRYKTTETLLSYLNSYSSGRFDGNLVELLNLPRKKAFLPANLKYILRDEYINTVKLMEFADITDYPVSESLVLDNSKIPANFLSFFKTKDCASSDCSECGFCALIAKKALTVEGEPLERLIHKYESLLDSLVSGEIYKEDKEPAVSESAWEADAAEAHRRLLESVPKIFRGTAARVIAAELAARPGNGSSNIGVRDVFSAWMKATPAPFKKSVEEKIKEISGAWSTTTS
ncbi:MAG: U32 family peptidase [Nitrospirota bacterium]